MTYFIKCEGPLTLQNVRNALREIDSEQQQLDESDTKVKNILAKGEMFQSAFQDDWWEAEKLALREVLAAIEGISSITITPLIVPKNLPTTWMKLLEGVLVEEWSEDGVLSPLAILWLKEQQARFGRGVPGTVEAVGVADCIAILKMKDEQKDNLPQTSHAVEHVDEGMILLQVNLDDASPEWLAYTMERLLAVGANDVNFFPMTMKKSRPAVMLQVLCYVHSLEMIKQVIFEETTTFGLRYFPVTCHRLARRFHKVRTEWGEIEVKLGYYRNSRVQVAPEYDQCARLARESGVPLKVIYQQATERTIMETPLHL